MGAPIKSAPLRRRCEPGSHRLVPVSQSMTAPLRWKWRCRCCPAVWIDYPDSEVHV